MYFIENDYHYNKNIKKMKGDEEICQEEMELDQWD